MTRRGPALLAATTALLALAALAAAAAPRIGAAARDARSRAAQRLLGGLGMGPTASLACEPCFDPRVGASCSLALEPVPAAAACPVHAGR